MATHQHEMRAVQGRITAVYTDDDGDEYVIRGGEREYPAVSPDWCPLCGQRHAPGDGTPGYSCED